jgi:hypothetical protein
MTAGANHSGASLEMAQAKQQELCVQQAIRGRHAASLGLQELADVALRELPDPVDVDQNAAGTFGPRFPELGLYRPRPPPGEASRMTYLGCHEEVGHESESGRRADGQGPPSGR